MNQLLGLAGDRGDDGGMAVPKTIDRDAGQEVEVLVPSVIPEDCSRTLHEKGGLSVIGRRDIFGVERFDRVVFQHVNR